MIRANTVYDIFKVSFKLKKPREKKMKNIFKTLLIIPLLSQVAWGANLLEFKGPSGTSSPKFNLFPPALLALNCDVGERATVSTQGALATEDHWAIAVGCTESSSGFQAIPMQDPNLLTSHPLDGNAVIQYAIINETGTKKSSGVVVVNAKANKQPVFLMRVGLTSGTPVESFDTTPVNEPVFHIAVGEYDDDVAPANPRIDISIHGNLGPACDPRLGTTSMSISNQQVNNVGGPFLPAGAAQGFDMSGNGSADISFPFVVKTTGTESQCAGAGP